MTRPPTANETAAYEAVKRLGSYVAAAAELGKASAAVQSAMRVYIAKTGVEWPIHKRAAAGHGQSNRVRERTAAITAIPGRLDELEHQVAELVRLSGVILDETQHFGELLAAFTARQPVILAPARDSLQPTHRRIADGGIGGRREARG